MGTTSDQKTVPAWEGSEPGLLRIMESPHENLVHPSDDRRQHVWVSRRMLLLLGALALAPVAAAWVRGRGAVGYRGANAPGNVPPGSAIGNQKSDELTGSSPPTTHRFHFR
jgi:hypothetical protein